MAKTPSKKKTKTKTPLKSKGASRAGKTKSGPVNSATPVRKGSQPLYWLFKSEPDVWSWDMQKAKGDIGEQWDGVRNYQARNNMQAMKVGDLGFFYHSNEGKEIVGIVSVCREAHPDTTTDDERWECVDVKAVADVAKTVSPR